MDSIQFKQFAIRNTYSLLSVNRMQHNVPMGVVGYSPSPQGSTVARDNRGKLLNGAWPRS